MAGVPKWKKEKEKRNLPTTHFTDDQQRWYMHCVRNDIRISPVATSDNAIGKWHIGISTPDDYKKIYKSPEICDKDTVWEVFHRYTKYYFDKHEK